MTRLSCKSWDSLKKDQRSELFTTLQKVKEESVCFKGATTDRFCCRDIKKSCKKKNDTHISSKVSSDILVFQFFCIDFEEEISPIVQMVFVCLNSIRPKYFLRFFLSDHKDLIIR
jgi:hypothetical protein